MDHHCVFLGKCVGRKNFKFFLQYCTTLGLLLTYGLIKMIWLFYTKNVENNEGV
jgi:hypothetical protein